MKGLPLNWQRTERGGRWVQSAFTAAKYRLYKLAAGPLRRLGLVRQLAGGNRIEVEIWRMPVENLGSFLVEMPAPLGLGKVEVIDGRVVTEFICGSCAFGSAEDVTSFGSWQGYLEVSG